MNARPLLTTSRLELWQPAIGDIEGLYALTSDPLMRRYLGFDDPGLPDSAARLLRNAGSWSLYGYGPLFVRRPGSRRIIGNCGVFHSWRGFGKGMDNVAEAGWIIAREHWGQGFATEAMAAILRWFDAEHGNRPVSAMISEENAASHKVAGALGFVAYDRHAFENDETVILYKRPAALSPRYGVQKRTVST